MKKLIERWRRLSGPMNDCDGREAFCLCANELEEATKPRSLKDSPPTPDDEHGEILVRGKDCAQLMVWRAEFGPNGFWGLYGERDEEHPLLFRSSDLEKMWLVVHMEDATPPEPFLTWQRVS